jgi:uncharacterized cupredoxin-like copper-binding protein
MGVVGAFAVLGLVACGGSTTSSTSSSTPSTAASPSAAAGAASGQTVNLDESEFKLAPATLTLKPGTYTFHVTNKGSVTHALEVEGNGMDEQKTGSISAGQSADLKLTLKAGTYQMYCPIDGHRGLGMQGSIKVSG